jgi:hypothetical protein
MYFDDIVVGDAENALDADTGGLEGSVGEWRAWYSTSVSSSADQAYSGTRSLLIAVTSGGFWGVQIARRPGFPTTSGTKRISYWARVGVPGIAEMTLRVRWFDASQEILRTTVPLTALTADWPQATADLNAPEGTVAVRVELYGGSAPEGSTVYIDNILVTSLEQPSSGVAPVPAKDEGEAVGVRTAARPWRRRSFAAGPLRDRRYVLPRSTTNDNRLDARRMA